MKLLAFSDIHENLVAVRKMRAAERNDYDAIVAVGDIGSECAAKFFKVLSTFNCPIFYVFGNWDRKLSYSNSYGKNCHLVHLNIFDLGGIFITGFSGCPANWGRNPIARKIYRPLLRKYQTIGNAYAHAGDEKIYKELKTASRETLEHNRRALGAVVRGANIDPRRCIVVNHQRLTHLRRELPLTMLHLFGHVHKFSETDHMGTKYVNVSALDRQISARPRDKKGWSSRDCRNYNAGNYVKIEISSSFEITVNRIHLKHDYENWIPLENGRFNGIEWIPEEKKWTRSSDPALPQYAVNFIY